MEHHIFTRRVPPKTLDYIVKEWDAIAITRRMQMIGGDDLSFDHVLAPALLSALKVGSRDSVLDVGCGTGVFTELLAARFQKTVGIDPSSRSLEQAVAATTRIEYIASSVEDYAN